MQSPDRLPGLPLLGGVPLQATGELPACSGPARSANASSDVFKRLFQLSTVTLAAPVVPFTWLVLMRPVSCVELVGQKKSESAVQSGNPGQFGKKYPFEPLSIKLAWSGGALLRPLVVNSSLTLRGSTVSLDGTELLDCVPIPKVSVPVAVGAALFTGVVMDMAVPLLSVVNAMTAFVTC